MKNIIELKFEKGLIVIAGYQLGERICKEQVIPNLKNNTNNEILIPSHIQNITSSFTEGFKSGILSSGYDNCKIEFKSDRERVAEKLMWDYYS